MRKIMMNISFNLGRRGAALLVFGVIFAARGGLLVLAPQDTVRRFMVMEAILPLQVWGFVWIGAAVLAAVQAFSPLRDGVWAFVSLTTVSGIWAAGYIAGWIVTEPPRGPRGWLMGLMWAAMFGLTIVLSGWKEPRNSMALVEDENETG